MMGKLDKPVVIGIAGGSGSGKTTIAHEIADEIHDDDHIIKILIIKIILVFRWKQG